MLKVKIYSIENKGFVEKISRRRFRLLGLNICCNFAVANQKEVALIKHSLLPVRAEGSVFRNGSGGCQRFRNVLAYLS